MSSHNSRSEQARINGAKSKGPITPEGKARSSMNALKSGRYSEQAVLLRNESRKAFEELFQQLVQRFRPRDAVELRLIRQLATVEWRRERYESMETLIVAKEFAAQESAFLASQEEASDETTLLIATDSVLENSKVPAFISNRMSQLVYEREAILRLIERSRKTYPIFETNSHPIEIAPLETDFEPNNEPKRNPADALAEDTEEAA